MAVLQLKKLHALHAHKISQAFQLEIAVVFIWLRRLVNSASTPPGDGFDRVLQMHAQYEKLGF